MTSAVPGLASVVLGFASACRDVADHMDQSEDAVDKRVNFRILSDALSSILTCPIGGPISGCCG